MWQYSNCSLTVLSSQHSKTWKKNDLEPWVCSPWMNRVKKKKGNLQAVCEARATGSSCPGNCLATLELKQPIYWQKRGEAGRRQPNTRLLKPSLHWLQFIIKIIFLTLQVSKPSMLKRLPPTQNKIRSANNSE